MDNIGLMSETVNFIQGSKKNYDSSAMQGGVYFSKDSKEILLNGESYGNAVPADEEDLTSVNGALQLKDREVDTDNFLSRGYVILRKNIVDGKNILTLEMINLPNTIYEIRYDFDLNGEEITIPEECVLKFEGGLIGNGTLNGNFYQIDAPKRRIFKDIKLTGDSAINLYYYVDWWIPKFLYSFIKTTSSVIDAYKYIQEALDSGAENFIFSSDRYYYLSKTLIIKGEINLFSDLEHIHFDGNDRAHRKEPPCIYSNEIVTLIDYKYSSSTYRGTLYIGTINLVCNKDFTDLSDKDLPILHLHADNDNKTTVWGAVIKCNIKAKDLMVNLRLEYPELYAEDLKIYAPKLYRVTYRG